MIIAVYQRYVIAEFFRWHFDFQ